jgi:hypothetical protein
MSSTALLPAAAPDAAWEGRAQGRAGGGVILGFNPGAAVRVLCWGLKTMALHRGKDAH